MYLIQEIEVYKYGSDNISFAGTLRNERKFEILQDVFIEYDGKMVRCKVVGIELPPIDNADYTYKIQLPKELMSGIIENRKKLTCQHIFSSIDEAKKSALKELEHKHSLNKENIERFFNQFENK